MPPLMLLRLMRRFTMLAAATPFMLMPYAMPYATRYSLRRHAADAAIAVSLMRQRMPDIDCGYALLLRLLHADFRAFSRRSLFPI